MIKRNWRTILIFIAIVADISVLSFTGFVSCTVRNYFPDLPNIPMSILVSFTIFFGIVLLLGALLFGVYRAIFHNISSHQYFLAGKVYLYSMLFIFSILFIFQNDTFPHRFTFLYFFIIPILFVFERIGLNGFIRFMQRRGYGIHNVVLVGYDNGGLSIIERFKSFPELGYSIKSFVTNKKVKPLSHVKIHDIQVKIFHTSVLNRIVREYDIDSIFIPSTSTISNGYSKVLKICQKRGIKLKVLSEESEELLKNSRVWDIAGITLVAPKREKTEKAKNIIKRFFDFVGSIILILILLPVFLLIVLAIFIEDGSPIIFTQKRALIKGKNEFSFIKFRSMIKGAESIQSDLYKFNEVTGGLFLMKDDPRITKVGRILRNYSLDELPQLFNVLLGDMSLVGPRPLSIADLSNISTENKLDGYYKLRAKAKPGITGLWQISGRREISFKEMVLLDSYYIENQSLLFDLEIIFATIPVVLFGKGAY
jgi:exopolysaccharide biosynthesis polyprenyl glycosylphosphotransferase